MLVLVFDGIHREFENIELTILVIFGYVIVGYVAGKKNLITKEQQRYLSKLVSSLILPFTVLSASSMEASGQDIVNVAIAVALLFFCMALTSAGCMLYAKIKHVPEKKRAAYTGLCTYPNCTFIGMPLCIALMGEWRSEERRVGKECRIGCRSRWSPYH